MTRIQYRTVFLVLLLVSFTVKIILWKYVANVDSSRFWSADSPGYHNTAMAFLQTGAFAVSPAQPQVMQSHRTPGFPLLIAGVYNLAGPQPAMVSLALILLSQLTISVTYRIACKLSGRSVALTASALLALDVVSLAYSMMFLTETLFTLFIVAMALSGVYLFQHQHQWWRFGGVGLLLAFATFVRPVSYYLIVLLAVLLTARLLINRQYHLIAVKLPVLLLPFVILIGGWQIRNLVYLDSLQFSTISGANLYYYRAASVVALRDRLSLEAARQKLVEQFETFQTTHPDTKNWTAGQVSDYLTRQGAAIIQQHPMLLFQSQIMGVLPMMLGGGEGRLLRLLDVPLGQTLDSEIFDALSRFDITLLLQRFASSQAVIAFLYALIYLGAVYGGVLWWASWTALKRNFTGADLFLWSVVFYFIFISAGPEANSRFRVPIMPILVIYAAQGLLLFSGRVKAKLYGR